MNKYYDNLIERYFEAETSEQEEQELLQFLLSPDAEDERYDEVRATMGYALTARKRKEAKAPRKAAFSHRWAAAACILLVCGAGFLTYHLYSQQEDCVAYVYGEKITDDETVENYMVSTMSETLASGDDDILEQQLQDIFDVK